MTVRAMPDPVVEYGQVVHSWNCRDCLVTGVSTPDQAGKIYCWNCGRSMATYGRPHCWYRSLTYDMPDPINNPPCR